MSRIPDDVRTLRQVIKELQGEVADLKRRSPFSNTGLSPDGTGGLTLQGVPLEPSVTTVQRCSASGFSVTTTYAEQAGVNFTVPTGCTRLVASCFARFYAVNANTTGGADTTGLDAIYVKVGIGSSLSTATPTGVSGSYGFATTVGFDSFEFSGLTPGATLRLTVQCKSGYQTIPAYVDNRALGVASLTFLR